MWNSLEIAKFIATLTTPIVVALVGFWITGRLKAQDRRLYREDEPHIRDEHARRAAFPHKLLKRNLVPTTKTTKWNYIFIEPGVKQDVSFTTLVPSDYSYLSAHVRFDYEKYRPHTAEAVFAVPNAASA